MNTVRTYTEDLSHDARDLRWLLQNFVEEVPGVHSVAVVSSDGLLLITSEPGTTPPGVPRRPGGSRADGPPSEGPQPGGRLPGPPSGPSGIRMDLAAVVSGIASLTAGASKLMDGGRVRQTTVAMAGGILFVMSISDGSLLGVHAAADGDMSVIAYHMARFVGRAGHVLTPVLRGELRQAMEGSAVDCAPPIPTGVLESPR